LGELIKRVELQPAQLDDSEARRALLLDGIDHRSQFVAVDGLPARAEEGRRGRADGDREREERQMASWKGREVERGTECERLRESVSESTASLGCSENCQNSLSVRKKSVAQAAVLASQYDSSAAPRCAWRVVVGGPQKGASACSISLQTSKSPRTQNTPRTPSWSRFA
jgi:hypothetical protein